MKAVFLDRDGTINIDGKGYISKTEDFELYPYAAAAIKLLNEAGFLVFVATNQSGVARGYYTFSQLDKLHEKMAKELATVGAQIDEIFISPYHIAGQVEPYNISHEDRKPGIGMFRQALKKYDFEIKRSFMVGDRASDIGFGKKAHLTSILLLSGLGRQEFAQHKSWQYQPDFVVEDLLAAARLIIELDNEN
ncbi:MAG: HAD family hydrolase [Candidatus Cloacimonadales bacterium]